MLDAPPFHKERERVGDPDCAGAKESQYRDPSPSASLRVRMKAKDSKCWWSGREVCDGLECDLSDLFWCGAGA